MNKLNKLDEITLKSDKQHKATLWLSCGLLIAIAWIFDPRLQDAFQLPKAALLYMGAPLLLAVLFKQGLAGLKPRGMDWPVLSFLAVCALFTVFSLNSHASFFGRYRLYIWGLWAIASLTGIYWAFSRLPEDISKRWLSNAIGAAGLGTIVYFLLQKFGWAQWGGQASGQPVSTLGNTINYAAFLAMVIPVWLSGLFNCRNRFLKALRVALLLGAGYMLLATLSRSAWLGTLVAVGVWLALNKAQWAGGRLKTAALAALLLVSVLGVWKLGPEDISRRISNFVNPRETSASTRLELWKMGLRIIYDSKGWGAGLDTFGYIAPRYETLAFRRGAGNMLTATYAHNELLQVGVTMGLLGLAAYIWLWVFFIRTALRRLSGLAKEERLISSGLFCACLALLVQNQFNFPSITTLAFLWAFMGGLAGSSDAAQTDAQQDKPRAALATRLAPALCCLAVAALAGKTMFSNWKADIYQQKAYVEIARSEWAKAADFAQKSLELNPGGLNYTTPLSMACRMIAQLPFELKTKKEWIDKAIAINRQYRDRYPLEPDANHNYAMSLMWAAFQLKEPTLERAFAEEHKAIALAPLLPEFWNILGQMHHFAGNIPEANKAWLRAIEIQPDFSEANARIEFSQSKDISFNVVPQDIMAENIVPGALLELGKSGGMALKIVNMGETDLRFSVSQVLSEQTTWRIPEGYRPASKDIYLEPEARAFTVGSNEIRVLPFRIQIPDERRFRGGKFCFLIQVRCTNFDVPVDRFARILVSVAEK